MERRKGLIRSRIDGEDHAILTVINLTAVEPEGGRRVHRYREGLSRGSVRSHGHEARVEAVRHGLAGRRERRLRHGVVLGHENELDGVAHGRSDLWGIVREGTATDNDLSLHGGRDGGEGGEGSGSESKTHLGDVYVYVSFGVCFQRGETREMGKAGL